jgi:hypothetical protein
MRRWLAWPILLILVPCTASAQSSREDGIRLLLAGDYQGAARSLQPLAENATTPDPAAQLLLAILYDNGHGVPRNVMRACGLYRQVAAADGPFRQLAEELGRMLHEDSPVPDQMCAAGPWHDIPAVSFTLEPNHSVEITSNSIVVRYQGVERRVMTVTLPGAITLPIIHTPLTVSQPVREERHFLQTFIWVPDNPNAPTAWTLGWILNEVVGPDFIPITGERNVLAATGAKPPAAIDLSRLAGVRLDANGGVEWIIFGGANPRSGNVPRREPK